MSSGEQPDPPSENMRGVIAGRDIRDSIITIGISEQAISERIADMNTIVLSRIENLADLVALEKGIPAAPLRAILARLGEEGVEDYHIPKRLSAAADELINLRRQLSTSAFLTPELQSLRRRALDLLDSGRLPEAKKVLQRGAKIARSLKGKAAQLEATFLSDEAKIDHLNLSYRAASEKYASAAASVREFSRTDYSRYIVRQADELEFLGRERGDNAALEEAIQLYKLGLKFVSATRNTSAWATIKTAQGIAEYGLGERQYGRKNLSSAVKSLRAAAKRLSPITQPSEWARTQNYLGNALKALGQRFPNENYLEEAVGAYRQALDERTPESAPLEWASTQNNLGTVYQALGERENELSLYLSAEGCYRCALQIRTPARTPLEWANTRDNLGVALISIGTLKRSTSILLQGVRAHEDALTVRTRARIPILWSRTKHNLGEAFRALGTIGNGTVHLRQSVGSFREALRERDFQRSPVLWANTWHEVGQTLYQIGVRFNRPCILRLAERAFQRALLVRTRAQLPTQWQESTAWLQRSNLKWSELTIGNELGAQP